MGFYTAIFSDSSSMYFECLNCFGAIGNHPRLLCKLADATILHKIQLEYWTKTSLTCASETITRIANIT